MKYVLSLFLLLALAAVGGCKHPSEPPGKLDSTILNSDTATVQWVTPHPGSLFIYSPGIYGPLDTVVILANALTLNGKTNVTSLDTLHSFAGLKGYEVFEANGDISIGDTINVVKSGKFGVDFGWTTYPTGSHKPITVLSYDNVYVDSTFGKYHYATSTVNHYIGPDTVMISNYVLGTIRVHSISTRYDSARSGLVSDSQATDYWFAPSIGTVVRVRRYGYDAHGQPVYPFESDLVKYVLK